MANTVVTGTITTVDIASAPAVGAPFLITGAPTAGSFVTVAVPDQANVAVESTGTWAGILSLEKSIDGGTDWFAINLYDARTKSWLFALKDNTPVEGNLGAASNFRVRARKFTSGSAAVSITVGSGNAGGGTSVTGVYLAADPTLTNAQTAAPRLDVNQVMLVHQGDLSELKDAAQSGLVWGKLYLPPAGGNPGVAYTVKQSLVFSNSTANTPFSIVPLVSGKQIQAVGFQLQVKGSGVVSFNFQDDAGTPVVLSMAYLLDKSGQAGFGGVQVSPNPSGCFVKPTTVSRALFGNLNAPVQVDGVVLYIEV